MVINPTCGSTNEMVWTWAGSRVPRLGPRGRRRRWPTSAAGEDAEGVRKLRSVARPPIVGVAAKERAAVVGCGEEAADGGRSDEPAAASRGEDEWSTQSQARQGAEAAELDRTALLWTWLLASPAAAATPTTRSPSVRGCALAGFLDGPWVSGRAGSSSREQISDSINVGSTV